MASSPVPSEGTHNTPLAMTGSKSTPLTAGVPCSICWYPFWTEETILDELPAMICRSFIDLCSSAEFGCAGCQILKQAWEWAVPDPTNRKEERINFNKAYRNFYFHLFAKGRVHNLDIFTLEGSKRFKHIRIASVLPPGTNLDFVNDRVRQWILACEQHHRSCQVETSVIPPRLLDLNMAVIGNVRVVETSPDFLKAHNISRGGRRYACLSHCWGESRSKHLTTRSNIDANREGIPIAELPRTFRDAIEVSRTLNIPFLWIDSCCIVQDDHADWEAHVKLMADIYRNAYITLAAGASEDDEGGFFRSPDDRYTKLHSFVAMDADVECKIYIRSCLPHPDENWPVGPKMPLMQRGWVFQERLLSRRFLCFAKNEILWECQEDVACSCSTSDFLFNYRVAGGPAGTGVARTYPRFLNCLPTKFSLSELSQLPRENLWSLWQELISQYTRRKLTYASDKLPALAGLATHFERAGAGTYHNGLWMEALETHLLWENSIGSSIQEIRPRNTPSWSWVSTAGGIVDWPELDVHSFQWQITGVEAQDTTDDEMDCRVPPLALEISGELIQICVELSSDEDDRSTLVHRRVHVKLGNANGLPCNPSLSSKLSELSGELESGQYAGNVSLDYKFWSDETSLRDTLKDIQFLVLGFQTFAKFFRVGIDPDADKALWVEGVLLRPVDNGNNATLPSFERIGWLRLFTSAPPEFRWKPIGVDTTFLFV